MIRFIFLSSFVILFLILSMPLMFIEWIIGKFNMDMKNKSSLAVVNWAFRCCLWITGVNLTVIGEDNVPLDTPVFYVGNHRSYFDILLTYTRVPRPTGYVAKKEMEKIPLLNIWMRNLHCLFLDRENVKEGLKTILTAIDKVKSGISICIFPEGTRNKVPDTFLPFHEGSFKVAEKSGCPIIPMVINNSADIYEDHFPKIKKTHVVLEYLPPVYIAELPKEDKKRIGALILNQIKEKYFSNKEKYFPG